MTRFYTRGGDTGDTSLLGGQRVPKTDDRIAACGDVDELNSSIGLARAFCEDKRVSDELERVQHDLFAIGAELVVSGAVKPPRISDTRIDDIEKAIDTLGKDLGEQRTFLLPGGTPCAAALQLARAVCRRAERSIAHASAAHQMREGLLRYINRLSSLLYVLARTANAGERETPPDYKAAEH